MSHAIIYINKDSVNQDDIDKNSTALDEIPKQALAILIDNQLNKETLLTSIAKACNFPSYFGHNWDALWDCLTDSEVKYLKLDLTDIEKINTEDFNTFKSIIEDAYRDFGQPQLWVLS